MARRIVITSGKGGVGKTTLTANLGTALAIKGASVCLIDADIGLNNLDVVMCIENKVVYDILDVSKGKCRPKQALVKDLMLPNLYILPSTKGGSDNEITTTDFENIAFNLDNYFDYILIDCPAGMDIGFHRAVVSSTEAIVVTTPNISAIRDADKTIANLSTYKLTDINLVINMMRGDLVATGEMFSVADISRLLRISPIGVIPADDDVILSNATTVNDKTRSRKAFLSLADNLMGTSNIVYDCSSKYKGTIGKLRSKIKRIL